MLPLRSRPHGGPGPCRTEGSRIRVSSSADPQAGVWSKELREEPELPFLPFPIQRKPPEQIVKLLVCRLPPIKDRLHDIRREQREPRYPTDVRMARRP